MFEPRNETQDFFHSITKNCGTIIDQAYRKAEELLEFVLTKSNENFFQPTYSDRRILDDWFN